MKKLLFLSIGLVLSSLSSEIKANPFPGGQVPMMSGADSDFLARNGLNIIDWCAAYTFNANQAPNEPTCSAPFTLYRGYNDVNFCGIEMSSGNVYGQCYLYQNFISFIPPQTIIAIPSSPVPAVITPYVRPVAAAAYALPDFTPPMPPS